MDALVNTHSSTAYADIPRGADKKPECNGQNDGKPQQHREPTKYRPAPRQTASLLAPVAYDIDDDDGHVVMATGFKRGSDELVRAVDGRRRGNGEKLDFGVGNHG